jgi:predicted esterase
MVAAELASRHPEKFAGAIALSPGGVSDLPPAVTTALPEHGRQGIVAVCGAQEHRTTRRTTEHYAAAFRVLGARVYVRQYAGMSKHRFPPDYLAKFPVWARFILDPDAPVPVP